MSRASGTRLPTSLETLTLLFNYLPQIMLGDINPENQTPACQAPQHSVASTAASICACAFFTRDCVKTVYAKSVPRVPPSVAAAGPLPDMCANSAQCPMITHNVHLEVCLGQKDTTDAMVVVRRSIADRSAKTCGLNPKKTCP